MNSYSTKIKLRILRDLEGISSPGILMQIFDFLKLIGHNEHELQSNRNSVLSLAGILSDSDAAETKALIDREFNQIEGDW